MIEIGNARDYWDGKKMQLPEYVAYVGRRNNRRGLKASPLANPFDWRYIPAGLRHTIAGHEQLVLDFRQMLRYQFDLTPEEKEGITTELARLRVLHEKHGKLVLVCWCHPKPCHASVIKEVLEAEG